MRTAKSCGPDASTLASSLREPFPQAMVTRKPDRQGEHEISRKTIARGNAGCFRRDRVTNACALYSTPAHAAAGAWAPGIPCALFSKEDARRTAKPGRFAPRGRERMSGLWKPRKAKIRASSLPRDDGPGGAGSGRRGGSLALQVSGKAGKTPENVSENVLVGVAGFEPATPASRT